MKNKRTFAALIVCCTLAVISISGCVQQMGKNGRIQPFEGSSAIAKLSGRPPEGTVAQSGPDESRQHSANFNLPRPFSKEMMVRGKVLYEVNCLPCHGVRGFGDGMVVQRGFLAPPSYHIERLLEAPDQHFYEVISHGYGAMYSYAYRVKPAERWAVVAYIRALQLSQSTPIEKLSAQDKTRLDEGVPQ